ncbi:MAG: hypothetical protein ACYC2X_03145 [Coriobacteriia bacterium]
MRRLAPIVALLLALCALLAACSDGGGGPLPHPAVGAVTELLELRRDDTRDVSAYAPYFEDAELAEALASPGDEPTGTPRVPPYRPPYLSAESTSTAEVAVVWESDDDFPDWAPVTIFSTKLAGGTWLIVDAIETTTAPEPLLPEAD